MEEWKTNNHTTEEPSDSQNNDHSNRQQLHGQSLPKTPFIQNEHEESVRDNALDKNLQRLQLLTDHQEAAQHDAEQCLMLLEKAIPEHWALVLLDLGRVNSADTLLKQITIHYGLRIYLKRQKNWKGHRDTILCEWLLHAGHELWKCVQRIRKWLHFKKKEHSNPSSSPSSNVKWN